MWSRALGLGLAPAARACRCSHGALALHALRSGRFVSTRYVSTEIPVPDHKVDKAKWSSESPTQDADHHAEVSAEDSVEDRVANFDQPKFETLEGNISSRTLRALTGRPFRLTHMSPVQAAVLPLLPGLIEPPKEGEEPTGPRDLLVKARTGTGKTLGFLIPAVESRVNTLRAHAEQVAKDTGSSSKVALSRAVDRFAKQNVGALIISPTRELATQIANEAIKLTENHEHFQVQLLVGGLPRRKQQREWNIGRRDIIVATPGRLRDFIENDPGFKEDLQTTQMFILDEADTLLEMGFREDIDAISQHLPQPPARQTFMFSATMPTAIEQVARRVLAKNHSFINCVPANAAPTHLQIPQHYTAVPSPDEQVPHILRLIAEDQLANPGKSKVLIFLPTTRLVQLYSTIIERLGPQVLPAGERTRFAEMHSKKAMNTRIKTSDWYRRDRSGASVMVTSDVSARGVDYPGVTRVIQVGVPQSRSSYVHRVGRTGRGKDLSTGRADLVLLPWELGFLTWQLMDIPLKELTTNQLQDSVTDLAQKHDADPSAFFPVEREQQQDNRRWDRRDRDQRQSLRFEPHVASRLEQIPEAIKKLQPTMDKADVIDALSSIMAFYASNSDQIRVQRPVTVAGIHQWAEALVGDKVHMRVPREFVDKKYRAEPRRVSPWEEKRTRENLYPWQHRGKVDKSTKGTFRQRAGHRIAQLDEERERRGDPWDEARAPRRRDSSERFPRRQYDGDERPPRRQYDGDERPPRRQYGDYERPPRRDGDRPPRRHQYDDGERPQRRQYDGERPQRRRYDDGERSERRGNDED
ncbi:DEAD-domain-containing protein [Lentinus tigrinus ALCF2SS1-7]|uniref:ATP-dependent RNA helicase n=1 Tax=Lentinus tigrinus ALCF2SS1-6 TaxID=1328759 RepID=A0A5C2SPF6_9APHY|nr:DEAD-domain-containing protein [Lentinus tigrinus ALCF2SS1-6]RPD78874.1 DEAD-domain-containing protein [Lentinus tigrinus ALCF2SS1-7]